MKETDQLVHDCLKAIFVEQGLDASITPDTIIYGIEGRLNSLALVRLIVELEDALLQQTGKTVILTDNKVLSPRNSPFRNLAALSAYVHQKVNDDQ